MLNKIEFDDIKVGDLIEIRKTAGNYSVTHRGEIIQRGGDGVVMDGPGYTRIGFTKTNALYAQEFFLIDRPAKPIVPVLGMVIRSLRSHQMLVRVIDEGFHTWCFVGLSGYDRHLEPTDATHEVLFTPPVEF